MVRVVSTPDVNSFKHEQECEKCDCVLEVTIEDIRDQSGYGQTVFTFTCPVCASIVEIYPELHAKVSALIKARDYRANN